MTTIKVGVDTNVVLGLLDEHDMWHKSAIALMAAVEAQAWETVYFDCAIAEAISTLTRRLHEKRRQADLNVLLDRCLQKFPPTLPFWLTQNQSVFYRPTIELIRASSGELNFNDALIALACRDYGIAALASFDADFDHVAWVRRLATPTDVLTLAQT